MFGFPPVRSTAVLLFALCGTASGQEAVESSEDRKDDTVIRISVAGTSLRDEERKMSPVPTATLNRADISGRANRRAGDLLKRMPGLYLSGAPGESKDARMRGLDKEFTRVQIDGVALPDGGEKREFQLHRLPASFIESVTLIRNPTSDYESDGVAGRISLTTRALPDTAFFEGRFGGGIAGAGDDSVFQGSAAFGFLPLEDFGLLGAFDLENMVFDITRKKSDRTAGFENEHERRDRRGRDMLFESSWDYGVGRLGIRAMALGLEEIKDKWKEKGAGARTSEREEEREDKDQRTGGVILTHRHSFGEALHLENSLSLFSSTEQKDKTKIKFKSANDRFNLDKRELEFEDKEDRIFEARTAVLLPELFGEDHELKLGGALRFRDRDRDKQIGEFDKNGSFKNKTTAADIYRLDERYAALFVQDSLAIGEHTSLVLGSRAEHVSTGSGLNLEAIERDEFDLNPTVHLVHRPFSAISLRGAFSRTLNRPKFDQLIPVAVEKDEEIKVGNPDLRTARSWNLDLGADFTAERLLLSANLLYKDVADVVEEVDTGADQNGKDVVMAQNVGHGWIAGLELEQRYSFGNDAPAILDGLTIWANETILHSRVRDAQDRLRRFKDQPRAMVNAGIDYAPRGSGAWLSVSCNYLSSLEDLKPSGDVRIVDPRTTIDMQFRQRLGSRLSFFLEIENLNEPAKRETEFKDSLLHATKEEHSGRIILAGLTFEL